MIAFLCAPKPLIRAAAVTAIADELGDIERSLSLATQVTGDASHWRTRTSDRCVAGRMGKNETAAIALKPAAGGDARPRARGRLN